MKVKFVNGPNLEANLQHALSIAEKPTAHYKFRPFAKSMIWAGSDFSEATQSFILTEIPDDPKSLGDVILLSLGPDIPIEKKGHDPILFAGTIYLTGNWQPAHLKFIESEAEIIQCPPTDATSKLVADAVRS